MRDTHDLISEAIALTTAARNRILTGRDQGDATSLTAHLLADALNLLRQAEEQTDKD